VPGLVIEFHIHQYIAWEELALTATFLTLTHLHHFFSGNQDLAKHITEFAAFNAILQRLPDLVLKAGIGVHDIPMLSHSLTPGASQHLYALRQEPINNP
jgi:hypothetical protein